MTIQIQDVNLSLSVNQRGELATRMLSPAQMSAEFDGMKGVPLLNDGSVVAGVGPNHTPMLVVVKSPPAAKKGAPTPGETAGTSRPNDPGRKRPSGG